jgi:hypothetical protein
MGTNPNPNSKFRYWVWCSHFLISYLLVLVQVRFDVTMHGTDCNEERGEKLAKTRRPGTPSKPLQPASVNLSPGSSAYHQYG